MFYIAAYIFILSSKILIKHCYRSSSDRKILFCVHWLNIFFFNRTFVHCDYSLLLLLTSSFIFPPFQNKTSNQKIKSLVQRFGCMQELFSQSPYRKSKTSYWAGINTRKKDNIAGGGHQQNRTQLFYLVRCPTITISMCILNI